MERKITYFETPGEENTSAVLRVVDEAVKETGTTKIIIASTYGATASAFMDWFHGRNVKLIIVPHQFGFREKRNFSVSVESRAIEEGHIVYWGTMLFHTEKLYGSETPRLIADFLRCFCQGIKVCVEILLMAGNAGLVDVGEEVIVIAGSHKGADTALIMNGATSMHFQKMHISRILCKPL